MLFVGPFVIQKLRRNSMGSLLLFLSRNEIIHRVIVHNTKRSMPATINTDQKGANATNP